VFIPTAVLPRHSFFRVTQKSELSFSAARVG
jgi:hypothetical protein